MIYFDNAATTYPKPLSVRKAVSEAMVKYGGNPGRSGHDMSLAASEAVFRVREKAAEMFGAKPENVVFTSNCTDSLNIAIKGFVKQHRSDNDGRRIHVIISEYEHNSVARPVYELSRSELSSSGMSYSVARIYDSDDDTAAEFERLIMPSTAAVICTLGSNVTGRIIPWKRIGELCRRHGICFIADGAQVCGVLPVKLSDGINILCMPGHKGLYGISGTGMLITDGQYPIAHTKEGGTGTTSLELEQPGFLPEELESGTVNTVGIVSMGAGMDFIKSVGFDRINEYEDSLCRLFISMVRGSGRVKVYRGGSEGRFLPIVLFNIEGQSPEETASALNKAGFALRGGLHCSGLGHRAAGTLPDGGVRFAPSVFNTPHQVRLLAETVEKLAK